MAASPLILRAPAILRAAGCEVVEYDGWRDRGRPRTFTPKGLTLHHDGSPAGPATPPEAYARFLFEVGRPAEGIPAPLCQFWIDYYGRWWVGAAGAANHALGATGWGAIKPGQANTLTAGVEMDNTTDEPTTPDQWEALHVGVPALFGELGWNPADALAAHKEVDKGRKFDPDDVDMPAFRAYVARALAGDSEPEPPSEEDDMAAPFLVEYQGIWFVAADLSSRTGLASTADFWAVQKATGAQVVKLTPAQIARIPVAGDVDADLSDDDITQMANAFAQALAGQGG